MIPHFTSPIDTNAKDKIPWLHSIRKKGRSNAANDGKPILEKVAQNPKIRANAVGDRCWRMRDGPIVTHPAQ